ncbi:uncharacterized protein TNCV_2661841 [Trichonephila clavipes]|nr:uncharacterized protein TNCV_2661841 [Trichonephila clavipes]
MMNFMGLDLAFADQLNDYVHEHVASVVSIRDFLTLLEALGPQRKSRPWAQWHKGENLGPVEPEPTPAMWGFRRGMLRHYLDSYANVDPRSPHKCRTHLSPNRYSVPLRHGGTLNSRRAANPLMWLVEGEERGKTSAHPQGFLPLDLDGTEQNRTVTCMVLKAKANERRKSSSP